MVRVGIGVPVYNGGEMLVQSLECLRRQSFADFEVVIGDNASDDRTGEICASFAARDIRFRHLRRPTNIGPMANFRALRAESDAELFCWRAHDDLSAPDYLERLAALFDDHPETRLAVAQVRTEADDRARPRITPWREPPARPRIARIRRQLFSSHASWIYGLWHRETLGRLQDRVHAEYPHDWGWDHLTLLPAILDGTVRGTNDTHFIQRIVRGATTRAERRARLPGLDGMRTLRGDFDRVARAIVAEREWNRAERAMLAGLLPGYIDRRSFSRARLMRRGARLALGIGCDKP